MVEIHLGGYLNYYDVEKRSRFSCAIAPRMQLAALLAQLGVPLEEVAMISINGELVDALAARLDPGDHIELYPPMGGG